jgi:transcriptional regulator with GAF, ATPase, and Fis domain
VALIKLGEATRTVLGLVGERQDERELAKGICEACVGTLDVDGAVVSLLTASVARETLWATDATAELLEHLQFSLNEGACMEAATTGNPVLVADLQHCTEVARWPMFAAAVAERTPVRALFALPLQWGAVNLGVLDLYRVQPGALNAEQRRDALGVADAAALLMLDAHTAPSAPGPGSGLDQANEEWLDAAASGNAQVHQATGMVLVQLGVSATVALARMRGHAFAERRLLVDVARDVVARRLRFTDDMR